MPARNKVEFIVSVVDKASAKLATIQSKFGKFTAAIAANAARIGSAFAAATVATVLFVNKITKEFDRLAKFSDLTGASVETLSQLEFAAKRSGVALQTLQVGIRGMTRNIADASTGVGEAVEAFRELNISAVDLGKLEFDQQLLILADAFANVESGTKRLVLAQDIFGGRAAELLKVFKNGRQGIIDYAYELDRLGGTVTTSAAEASARYQDSLTNLASAFQSVTVALVDSGLIDAMTDFVDSMARGIAVAFGANELGHLNARLIDLNIAMNDLKQNFEGDRDEFWQLEGVQNLDRQIKDVIAQITELEKAREKLSKPPTVGGADPVLLTGGTNPLQSFVDSFDTASQQVAKQMEKFRDAIVAGLIPEQADRERIAAEIRSIFTDGIEEIDISTKKRYAEMAEAFDPVREAAVSAFRSIQQTMADFLFDPFDKGIKGMLKGFIDVIRRMIAEVVAAQLMKKLFGDGSVFSDVVSDLFGRASGGPVAGGQTVRVHEGELVSFGAKGGYVASKASQQGGGNGSPSFTTNIDARGADPGLIARLPLIMEQRDRQLLLKMKRYLETGMIPV